MTIILHIVEFALLAAAGTVTAYLALLSVLSLFASKTAPVKAGRVTRFAVVVPAHDEENTVGRTLSSLARLDYPAELFEVFVVADNCADGTADAARRGGATVLERTDAVERGKGHALRWAFDLLLGRSPSFDAFVVIDADSVVSENFLAVMDARVRDGAEAIQANDQVTRNTASWSSEITRLGFTLYNFARPLGRGVLGGSAGLRGNGMCFSAGLLRRLPWNAFGVTEDLQYGLNLLLAGVRVRFAPDAVALATMPAIASNAETQRVRWEQGRLPVKRAYGRKLLAAGLSRMSWTLIDSWIDLVTPPFVHLMAVNAAVAAAHALLAVLFPATFLPYAAAWGGVLAAGLVHVFAGLASARADAGLYLALLHVPRYAFWKLLLRLKHPSSRSPEDWIRTTRETQADGAGATEHKKDGITITPHT